jgi:hypothetical protein
MAQVEIRLDIDPKTGKKNVTISYASDSDALPMEHEEDHRAIVDRLIEGGAIKAGELGEIVVEREESAAVAHGEQKAEGQGQRESINASEE